MSESSSLEELEYIISPDKWAKYGDSAESRGNERVREWMEKDMLTPEQVYERYTHDLMKLRIYRDDEPLDDSAFLKQNFDDLRDPKTKGLSRSSVCNFINACQFADKSLDPRVEAALFDLLNWHASFPFPAPADRPIGRDAFVRAVCLLTLSPAPYMHPRLDRSDAHPNDHNTMYSFRWGPYQGSIIDGRSKHAGDFRRRLFRSLAVPIPPGTDISVDETGHVETIPIPRFLFDDTLEADGSQLIIVVNHDEDERCIDILDMLAELSPDRDNPMVGSPAREAYDIVLPTLPKHEKFLHELVIPYPKLVGLLEFLNQLDSLHDEDDTPFDQDIVPLLAAVSTLEAEARLGMGWKRFDSLFGEYSMAIGERLSFVFLVLKRRLVSQAKK